MTHFDSRSKPPPAPPRQPSSESRAAALDDRGRASAVPEPALRSRTPLSQRPGIAAGRESSASGQHRAALQRMRASLPHLEAHRAALRASLPSLPAQSQAETSRAPSSLPPGRPSRPAGLHACSDFRELRRTDHYLLRLDARCGFVVATRTPTPFDTVDAVGPAFHELQRALVRIAPAKHALLVDVRQGPSRNDEAFEAQMRRHGQRFFSSFGRQAFLARTAAGQLQLRRFAEASLVDEVLVTTSPAEALTYLGLGPHAL